MERITFHWNGSWNDLQQYSSSRRNGANCSLKPNCPTNSLRVWWLRLLMRWQLWRLLLPSALPCCFCAFAPCAFQCAFSVWLDTHKMGTEIVDLYRIPISDGCATTISAYRRVHNRVPDTCIHFVHYHYCRRRRHCHHHRCSPSIDLKDTLTANECVFASCRPHRHRSDSPTNRWETRADECLHAIGSPMA